MLIFFRCFQSQKIGFLAILFFFNFDFSVHSQETGNLPADSLKKGFNIGILPAISYSSDIGFQYGALANLYFYGDGSRYPAYDHSLYLEWSRTTKGSGINRIYYDSDQLLRGIRISSDLSLLTEQAMDFYGFNGYESAYKPEWEEPDHPDYRTRMFYRFDRRIFRFLADFQGSLNKKGLLWLAGAGIFQQEFSSVDIDRLNRGKKEEDLLPSTGEMPGLYERYLAWNVLDSTELDGGNVAYAKAGLVWDTRDNRANPGRGIWAEASLVWAPSVARFSEYSYSKISLIFRHYHSLIPGRLRLASRIGYQTSIFGDPPFFMQSHMITSFLTGSSTDGLGGQKSMRGILRNRVVGDGIVYGNLELRWILLKRYLWKQNFYLGMNAFYDAGRVTRPISLNTANVTADQRPDYFPDDQESLHQCLGLGVKVAMNQNFIVSGDYGRALDPRDGKSGVYIGLNYLF